MSDEKQSNDLLVFITRREGNCGEALPHGCWITLEKEKGALCLSCADLDHLLYLPAGDAALTRRATKFSKLHAKVLEWSRTRKQYERQGILVEAEALEKAETECLADEDVRQRRREREAVRREERDEEFVYAFGEHILRLFPKCPTAVADQIAEHACLKHSGRVGRSAAAKEFEENAISLAVRAHVRHAFTDYDELLLKGHERGDARRTVAGKVEEVLANWRGEEAS